MIPNFPVFKKLSIDDQKNVEKYINSFPPYSDYNFISLWSWNTDNKIELSLLNENLVIKFSDYLTNDTFLSFIGTQEVTKTIKTLLLNGSQRDHIIPAIKLIPEITIESDRKLSEYFSVNEDRDNFDYIYSIDEFLYFKGTKYGPKRNFVNRFVKKYQPNHEIIDLTNRKNKTLIKNLFETWREGRKKDLLEVRNEYTAVERLLKKISVFDLLNIGIFIDEKLIAFSINQVLPNGYAINLFEKGDIAHQGVFQYLRQITAKYLKESGCEFLNHEQDLGIEGLRKSKMSYHPKFFLKKYIITPKTS